MYLYILLFFLFNFDSHIVYEFILGLSVSTFLETINFNK